MSESIMLIGILSIFLMLFIFIMLREFWCWYYKINSRKRIEEEILETLKKQNVLLQEILQKPNTFDNKESGKIDIKI